MQRKETFRNLAHLSTLVTVSVVIMVIAGCSSLQREDALSVSGGHSGGLFALKGSAPMANSPWPKVQRDIHNSGRVEPEMEPAAAQGSAQPWSHLNMNNDPDNFQFAIVSDRTGGHRIGVFEDAIHRLNLLQPEFVISVGDFIEGYTEDVDTLNKQWDEFEDLVSKIEMPFFYVPGNHDISNRLGSKIWKERFGRDYYHFVYKDVLFLCLNTEDIEDLEGDDESPYFSEEQRDYVIKALTENPDVRWTLVFFHAPVWDERETAGGEHDVGYWPDIERLLKARKHTVIAGHQHRYSHLERKNTDHIVLSTTGGASRLRGPLFGEFDHVVWVTMTDEGPRIANLMLSGIWDKKLSPEYLEAGLRGRKNPDLRLDLEVIEPKETARQSGR